MIRKLSLLLLIALFGLAIAEGEGYGRGYGQHDDEWVWTTSWCPQSTSWTSTRVRRPCTRSICSESTVTSLTTVSGSTVILSEPCETITATLWDIHADTLIICHKYTTDCPASFSSKATITFTVKAQAEDEANSAARQNTGGLLIGAGLAFAGLVALFF